MNKYFDSKRFGRYLAYDLHNLRANYGLSLLLLGCMPVVLYLLTVLVNLLTHGLFGSWEGWVTPPIGARIGIFFVTLLILCISFPVKQYGALTEKRYGSDWLMIPASRLEKFLSMMLVTLVVVPFAFLICYNLTDGVLSLCDPTYGKALASINLNEMMYGANAGWNEVSLMEVNGRSVPVALGGGGFWILWTNMMRTLLVFLLGALCFKRKKVPMTILCLIALSIVLSTILSLFFVHFSGNIEQWFESLDVEKLQNANWNLRVNLAIWMDVIVIVGGLGTAIWFRLKTLKH